MADMNYQYGGKDIRLLQFLEERVRKNPASSFFAMLAYFYLDVDRIGEALSIAQRGVIAHPNYSTGHAVLAMAMMRAGLYMDARKELAKAEQLHPGSQIIGRLKEDLEKQEQADSIGRKLAEQYRKNASAGGDIMKTVEETLKSKPASDSHEDLLIPGLDAIVGEELSPVEASLAKGMIAADKSKEAAGKDEKSRADKGTDSGTARAIIDKVAREFADKTPQSEAPGRSMPGDPPQNENKAHQDTTRIPGNEEPEFDVEIIARKLEAAGPIKPENSRALDKEEDGGIELTQEIVTDTLAAILEQQGQIKTAMLAYSILIRKKPEKAGVYLKKIEELRSKANDMR